MNLPPPDMGNLLDIASALREVSPFQRDRVAEQILRGNYLRRLLDFFRVSGSLQIEYGNSVTIPLSRPGAHLALLPDWRLGTAVQTTRACDVCAATVALLMRQSGTNC